MMKSLRAALSLLAFLLLISPPMLSQTPVAVNGQLQVIGTQLCNEDGYPVQLRGMSSHGLQWFGDCINQSSIQVLKEDWGADVIRLAMYVEENGYITDPDGFKALIEQKADWIIAQDLYVIIDWHVHIPGDPNVHIDLAKDFFDHFSTLYANDPHVIFEIANEPNKIGDNSWSTTIKPYAEEVIPVIRANSPDAIVLVGTPIWSSKPGDILTDPLTGNNAEDVLYSFHFYSGSHFTQAYINAFSDKVPIFMNEWGTSINKGNTGNDYENTQLWFDLMLGNNQGRQLMSWCNWSFCDKAESSAALVGGGNCNPADWNSVSPSGAVVKEGILTPADNFISGNFSLPQFSVLPFDQTVVEGTSAYFRAKAEGPGMVTYQWYFDDAPISGADEAIFVLKDVDVADEGMYKVTATNLNGSSTSREVSLTLDSQAPRSGSPFALPGRIEIEEYDLGGNDVAFKDVAFPPNLVGEITETTGDNGGVALTGLGYNDWMEYTVNFPSSAYYTFKAHYYSEEGSDIPQFWVALDNVTITKIHDLPHTDFKYNDVTTDTAWVEKGTYVMRILIEERIGAMNFPSFRFDYLDVIPLNIDCNGEQEGTAFLDSCGVCVGGTTGLSPAEDADDDGTYDCDDACPNDPNKIVPGVCGCGVEDGTCEDCAGLTGGFAVIDACGICSGGNTGIEPDSFCTDCNGEINGTASLDECGACSGGSTGIAPNATCTDCFGVINGDAELDDCGVCGGDNSTCLDCFGTPNGTAELDACGECNGDGGSCVGQQLAYDGLPQVIPGTVEMEKYDLGGSGIAFNDNDGGNNGGLFRNDDVDIAANGQSGYALGWIGDGEWVEYTVNVLYAGSYEVRLGAGGPLTGKQFDALVDGELLLDDAAVPTTSDWSTFTEASLGNVDLPAGEHVLRLEFATDGFNLDFLTFTANFSVDCNLDKDGTATVDQCGVCSGGATGVTPNTTCLDCNGVLNGGAYEDRCGNCVGGTTNRVGCVPDCQATFGGTAYLDSCGVCVGGATGREPCARDCQKVLNGSADIDACGNCAGGNTGIVPETNGGNCVINALEKVAISYFNVFPNPSTEGFTVQLDGQLTVEVTNLLGQVVEEHAFTQNGVFGKDLEKGVYLLRSPQVPEWRYRIVKH